MLGESWTFECSASWQHAETALQNVNWARQAVWKEQRFPQDFHPGLVWSLSRPSTCVHLWCDPQHGAASEKSHASLSQEKQDQCLILQILPQVRAVLPFRNVCRHSLSMNSKTPQSLIGWKSQNTLPIKRQLSNSRLTENLLKSTDLSLPLTVYSPHLQHTARHNLTWSKHSHSLLSCHYLTKLLIFQLSTHLNNFASSTTHLLHNYKRY